MSTWTKVLIGAVILALIYFGFNYSGDSTECVPDSTNCCVDSTEVDSTLDSAGVVVAP